MSLTWEHETEAVPMSIAISALKTGLTYSCRRAVLARDVRVDDSLEEGEEVVVRLKHAGQLLEELLRFYWLRQTPGGDATNISCQEFLFEWHH